MQHIEINRDFVDVLSARIREKLNFMQIIVGPRQVGKTRGVTSLLQQWDGPKHFATADKVSPPDAHWIEVQWQIARATNEPTLLVLDEIQKIPRWDETIKALFDQDRSARMIRVVLLGSASTSIQKGLSESLAGRFELIKVHHWRLSECKRAFGWTLVDFLKFGGYPSPAEFINDIPRWQSLILDSIIEPVLTRDIQGLVQINKPALFRQTFELALSYPAQEISLQKLLGQLQDRGNVTSIKNYLSLFEGAFLIKTLQKYSGKKLVERGSSPKILPLCSALVNAYVSPTRIDTDPEWLGRIFEQAIGAHLASHSQGKLFYWRQGKDEVDYVLEVEERLFAIEVKSGRKRNTTGIGAFCKQFRRATPVLIDRDSGEQLLMANNHEEIQRILEGR